MLIQEIYGRGLNMSIKRDRYQKEEELQYKIYDKDNNEILSGTYLEDSESVRLPWNMQKALPPDVSCIITRPGTGETEEIFYKYSFRIHAPKFIIPDGDYRIDVGWDYLEFQLENMIKYTEQTIEEVLNPEFQRGHAWTEEQQISYVEYILKGGKSGREVYFNCSGWDHDNNKQHPYYCIDGLQRITAVRRFMNNEFPVFDGRYVKDTTGIDMLQQCFSWHVLDFQAYDQILDWYISLNETGVSHTKEELDRVRKLKENC